MVHMQFRLDPYNGSCAFIFCNKKRNGIKILRYDSNGFILASKKLLEDMKFQWPRTPEEVKEISFQQVEWLLQGLEIEQKKALHEVSVYSDRLEHTARRFSATFPLLQCTLSGLLSITFLSIIMFLKTKC